jgi:excinuclease UvrABC ATPase subunit
MIRIADWVIDLGPKIDDGGGDQIRVIVWAILGRVHK